MQKGFYDLSMKLFDERMELVVVAKCYSFQGRGEGAARFNLRLYLETNLF